MSGTNPTNLTACSDAELIRRACRENEVEAFGELARRYRSFARRVALTRVKNAEIAQELVQEALLQAFLSLSHLQCETRFPAWLAGIVRNVSHNHLRQNGGTLLSESYDDSDTVHALFAGAESEPPAIAERRELEQMLLNAIHTLSPANRDVVLLFYYDQQSLHEIAALLGISVTAVKGRLHKSRCQLREALPMLLPTPPVPMSPRVKPAKGKTMVSVRIEGVDHRRDLLQGEDPRTSEENARRFVLAILASPSPGYARDHVLLIDASRTTATPLYVDGAGIADAILRDYSHPDSAQEATLPQTYGLMNRLLEATGTTLESVTLERLDGSDVTYAALALKPVQSGGSRKATNVHARAGDALALAAQQQTPITASAAVLDRDRWDLSQVRGIAERLCGENATVAAVTEPTIVFVADATIDQALHMLHSRPDAAFVEVLMEPRAGRHGYVWVEHRAGGCSRAANVPMPRRALPLVIARFQHMVGEEGQTTVQRGEKSYLLQVRITQTEAGERLELRLEPVP